MICPYCGKENPDNLEICNFCGGPLSGGTEQPAVKALYTIPPAGTLPPAPEPQEAPAESSQPALAPEERPFAQPSPPAAPSGRLYNTRIWWIVGCVVFLCLVLACIGIVLGLYRYTKVFGFLNPDATGPALSRTAAVATLVAGNNSPSGETSQGTPGIPAQNIPGILFYDDFSNPGSGWDQFNESDYSVDYYQGAYHIMVKTDMFYTWGNPAGQDFEDVSIETDATKNGGPDDNDIGVICRYKDTDHFYYADISSDGYFGIVRVSGESSVILGRDYLEYSNVINQGAATNHIRFDCVAEQFTLFVNGDKLDQQTDGEYSSGNVGLLAGSYETPGTDILFDNFGVYVP